MVALRMASGAEVAAVNRLDGRPGKEEEVVRLKAETRLGAPVPTVLVAIVSR
jgi:hypothetical protein